MKHALMDDGCLAVIANVKEDSDCIKLIINEVNASFKFYMTKEEATQFAMSLLVALDGYND